VFVPKYESRDTFRSFGASEFFGSLPPTGGPDFRTICLDDLLIHLSSILPFGCNHCKTLRLRGSQNRREYSYRRSLPRRLLAAECDLAPFCSRGTCGSYNNVARNQLKLVPQSQVEESC